MHRIATSGRAVDKHGSGKDGFTEGDPANGTPPTETSDDWHDAVQEEIANAVEGVGESSLLATSSDTYDQLNTAIKHIVGRMFARQIVGSLRRVDLGTTNVNFNGAARIQNVYANVAIVVGDGGNAQVSNDFGLTWAGITSGTAENFNAASRTGNSLALYAVGENNAILFKSFAGSGIDPFASWTLHSETGDWNDAAPADATTSMVIVGDGGAVMTGAGTSWTSRTSGTAEDLLCVARNPATGTIVAGGRNGALRRSTNNGVAWSGVTSGVAVDIVNVHFSEYRSRWFASTATGGALLVSADDGATWSSVTPVTGEVCADFVAVFGTSVMFNTGTDLWLSDSVPTAADTMTHVLGVYNTSTGVTSYQHPIHWDGEQMFLVTDEDTVWVSAPLPANGLV